MATKAEYERTCISLPKGTMERAKKAGVNVSGTCAKAVISAIELLDPKVKS
jgi:post-segregation antitoxin (ccd killing protein)